MDAVGSEKDFIIAVCTSNPGASYYQKELAYFNRPNTGTFCRRPVVRPSPFSIDPGLHSKITAADWANLQRQVKVTLAPGTLVAIRIKFGIRVGTYYSIHHKLPHMFFRLFFWHFRR